MGHEQSPDHVGRFKTDVVGFIQSTVRLHELQRIEFTTYLSLGKLGLLPFWQPSQNRGYC